ncbi:MAG: AI-2E family transporter [Gaiellaceae bacterium]
MIPERLVRLRARTVFAILGIVLSVAIVLQVVWLARGILTWIVIALFFALALNPAVDSLVARKVKRPYAVAIVSIATLLVLVGIAALFIPPLVDEVNKFRLAVPDYVDDVTQGRGALGEFAERYDLVERVRKALNEGGGFGKVLGVSGVAVSVAKGVVNVIVAIVTIIFLTFFMLLEGPQWLERFYSLVPAEQRPRIERINNRIYRTIGGYVTGNLFISVIAGTTATLVLYLLGVPYAVVLGLLVAILDLVPLAGATLAAILVSTIAFITTDVVKGLIVVAFFVVYQQVENHVLQPLVYSRTVQLSPLAILISVLLGAELAGVLGALAAIPVAGTIQVFISEWILYRRERVVTGSPEPEPL